MASEHERLGTPGELFCRTRHVDTCAIDVQQHRRFDLVGVASAFLFAQTASRHVEPWLPIRISEKDAITGESLR